MDKQPTVLDDQSLHNFRINESCAFSSSHISVKQINVDNDGLLLKKHWLAEYNFMESTEASLLLLPGYLVVTNHPGKQKFIKAIEELQFRQDELKEDFSGAIISLAKQVRY